MGIEISGAMFTVRAITPDDYKPAHALQCEYLDAESFDSFLQRVEANSSLYLVAIHKNEVVGVCYGEPSKRDEQAITLQGIAVNLDETKGYARTGIGSKMLSAFEVAVKDSGYPKIGVGSADDRKVEHFYLKNGFYPVELVAKGLRGEELERVPVNSYESGDLSREALRQQHDSKEVIFIFEKRLGAKPHQ